MVNMTVLHDPRLAESEDAEPWIRRPDCKAILGFSTAWRVCAPNPHTVRESTVIYLVFVPIADTELLKLL